jgi:hypothetical protein
MKQSLVSLAGGFLWPLLRGKALGNIVFDYKSLAAFQAGALGKLNGVSR